MSVFYLGELCFLIPQPLLDRGTGACLEYLLKNGLDIAILRGTRKILTVR